jgi:hypothetical protein
VAGCMALLFSKPGRPSRSGFFVCALKGARQRLECVGPGWSSGFSPSWNSGLPQPHPPGIVFDTYARQRMSALEIESLLAMRKRDGLPWHYPPRYDQGVRHYMITAACYRHEPIIPIRKRSDLLRIGISPSCSRAGLLPGAHQGLERARLLGALRVFPVR